MGLLNGTGAAANSWQRDDVVIAGTDEVLPKDAVCLLDVPVQKTGFAFTKPVDRVVVEAITRWEHERPDQPVLLDRKTAELVHFLFACRGRPIGEAFLNTTLIPAICRKAGVPERDARGTLTSHHARATIATQLFNSKEPLSLFELQAWLGHSSPQSTQHYARITPTRLAKAYADAGYFARNMRSINVLIDRDAIVSGAAAKGEPWRFYDLGHGLCTYEFFDQCPPPDGVRQVRLLRAEGFQPGATARGECKSSAAEAGCASYGGGARCGRRWPRRSRAAFCSVG